jgi:hypothetical protein
MFQGSWFSGAGMRSGSVASGRAARWSMRHAMEYSGFRLRQLAWVFCRRAAWQSGLQQARCRSPTRGFGRNHRRQMVHGLFRASGIVMIYRLHHTFSRISAIRGQVRTPGSFPVSGAG